MHRMLLLICTQRRNILHHPRGEVFFIIVVPHVGVLLLVLVITAVLLNRAIKHTEEPSKAPRVSLFEMKQSSVRLISYGEGIVASTQTISCEQHLPVSVESKALLCVGNRGRKIKVELVASTKQDKALPVPSQGSFSWPGGGVRV